jgi:AraC-like DNA-binding protein
MHGLTDLAAMIARHAPGDGLFSSPIERLSLVRSSRPTLPMPVLYEPVLCLVAQGRKQVSMGERTFTYLPGRFVIVSVEVPVIGHVVEASPAEPYLCFVLRLDPVLIGELAMQVPAAGPDSPLGLRLTEAGPDLVDAACRLLGLLADPAAIPVLAPLAEREILYRLLAGPFGGTLRQIVAGHGRVAQVARAIAWIRQHFADPFRIEALAGSVGMSASTLHEHFRAVTAMSPLQYQKQLRLQEARRLMLASGLDAATAAFRVGYESPSHFSREYRRLFGEPPARDVQRLRASPELTIAA